MDSSRFAVIFVVVNAVVAVGAGISVCGCTVVPSRTAFCVCRLFLWFLNLTAMVFILSSFIRVLACWFELFESFSSILARRVQFELIGSFQTIQLLLSFQVCENLFIYLNLQVGLVY